MRRATIVMSSAIVCSIAAVLFLWSVSPRSPAEGVTLDTHGDGDATAPAVALTDTRPPAPVPMASVADAPTTASAADRPHDDATARDATATTGPKTEFASTLPPAPAPAPAPSVAPAVAAGPTKIVEVADGTSTGEVTVGQKNREFTVRTARLKAGGAVKFVNDDSVAHNVIITTPGGKLRNTGVQEPGQSASMQFAEPGKYDVECAIHPQMKMTVDVQ